MLVVIFHAADAAYGIRCQSIVEVIPRIALRPVPHAPSWLSGTFTYRGELTPVVDMCQLIGRYACPARLSSRIIVVRFALPDASSGRMGLLAERVTEARRIAAPALPAASLGSAPYFGEVLIEEGSALQMIDVDGIPKGTGAALVAPPHARLGAGEEDRSVPEP